MLSTKSDCVEFEFLHDYAEPDPEGRMQIAAFRDELARLGWKETRNLVIDLRSGADEAEALRASARELLAKSPDVVLGAGGTIVAALQRATKSVPIVFANVTDPVGGGLVSSLARPGGNTTGFTQFEFGISAKWLEQLKEIAPTITQVASYFAIQPREVAADNWARSREWRRRLE